MTTDVTRRVYERLTGVGILCWPHACTFASAILVRELRALESDAGWALELGVIDRSQHCWCGTPEGRVADVTYGQFAGRPPWVMLEPHELTEHWPQHRVTLAEEQRALAHFRLGWRKAVDGVRVSTGTSGLFALTDELEQR